MSKETKPKAAHLAKGESEDQAIIHWNPERGFQDRVWAPLLKCILWAQVLNLGPQQAKLAILGFLRLPPSITHSPSRLLYDHVASRP